MSAAFLLDGGQLFVTQAAVQSIVVSTLVPDPGAALTRWTDALIGGAVALVAATVVPAAPLRRPREQAAVVMRKIAALLRAAGEVMVDGEVEPAMDLLADARTTDYLIRELQDAADEGLSVVASSPFRVRHSGDMRQMVELVDPLDRALRSTRVLVRQTAVAAYHRRPVPQAYALLAPTSPTPCDQVADELAAEPDGRRGPPAAAGGRLRRPGGWSGAEELPAEVILAQLRVGGRRPAAAHRDGPARGDRRAAATAGDERPRRPVHRGCCTSTSTSSSPRSRCCAGRSSPACPWSSAAGATRPSAAWCRPRPTRPASSASAPACRCGWPRASARTRCSCRSTRRPTRPRRRR